jgi:hypothetical protein
MVFKGKYCGLSINLIFLPLFRLELGESEDRIKLRFLIWGFLGDDFGGKGRLWLDRLVFCFCVVLLSLSLSLSLSLGTRCVSSLSSSTASLLRLRIWESNGAHDYIVLTSLLAVEVYIYIYI